MTEFNPNSKINLKRQLNFPLLLFYSTGTILGLGIYVILGKVIGVAGTLAPFAFIIAAIIAIFSALSYSELSARIPKSGGVVNYVEKAFNKKILSQIIGYLLVISAIISTATVLNGYVGYVHTFAHIPAFIIISLLVIVLSGVAIWGISKSATLITIICLIELIGIFLVIFLTGDVLAEFPNRISEFIPSWNPNEFKGILTGSFLAFFTFIGFEDVVNVAEEAKNPEKNMPKAIIISLIVLTVLYILISIIGVLSLSTLELKESSAPLADILAQKNSHYPLIISLIGLVAIINGVLVQIVMIARVLFGMAREKLAPVIFSHLNPKTHTPIWATVFSGIIILLLALSFKMESLAMATNYILLLVFAMVNLSLLIIKKREKNKSKIKKCPLFKSKIKTYPLFVPILGLILTLMILLVQIYFNINY